MSDALEFEEEGGRRGLRRLIVLVVLLLAAGGGAAYWYLGRDESKPAVVAPQTATVSAGSLVTTLSASGVAAAIHERSLAFAASSTVASVSVSVGDAVKAGQELARANDTAAQRDVTRAEVALRSQQSKLDDLLAGATAVDLASANQSVVEAQISLKDAQDALADALDGPSADEIKAADAAITKAEDALTTAKSNVTDAEAGIGTAERTRNEKRIALTGAQREYCSTFGIVVFYCDATQLPLTDAQISDLTYALTRLTVTGNEKSAVISATNGFVAANDAYVKAVAGISSSHDAVTTAQRAVANAEDALATARENRADLFSPPDSLKLDKLRSNVTKASVSLQTAEARLKDVQNGAKATEIDTQRLAVADARATLDKAQDTLANTVLKAPFDGMVTRIGVAPGDVTAASTVAMVVTDQDHVQISFSVSESDLTKLAKGQWASATFDALPNARYILQVSEVSRTPTVSQGVTSYAVIALVVRPSDLDATERADLANALPGLLGTGTSGSGFTRGAAQGTPRAGVTPQADRTPGGRQFNGTPPAGFTPGAGGPQGGNRTSNLDALLNQTPPVAGMSAKITVLIKLVADQVLVPTGAIKTSQGVSTVTVVHDDGTTEERTVTLGGSDETNTAIASGLTVGEVVQVASTRVSTSAVTSTQTSGQGFPGGGAFPGGGGTTGGGGSTVR